MRMQGLSFRAIARKTGLGYGTVRRAYLAAERVGVSAAD
jgi:transposase